MGSQKCEQFKMRLFIVLKYAVQLIWHGVFCHRIIRTGAKFHFHINPWTQIANGKLMCKTEFNSKNFESNSPYSSPLPCKTGNSDIFLLLLEFVSIVGKNKMGTEGKWDISYFTITSEARFWNCIFYFTTKSKCFKLVITEAALKPCFELLNIIL